MQLAEDVDERVLDDIFGVVFVMADGIGEAVHRLTVAMVEFGKSPLVALPLPAQSRFGHPLALHVRCLRSAAKLANILASAL